MLHRLTLTFALIVAMLPMPAFAESLYDEDLRHLSGELRALMLQAGKRSTLGPQQRYDLGGSLFELQKKLNRLQEEAMSANLALQSSGQPRSRDLVFAASIADSLNLARAHTNAYLDTGDKAFSLAASNAARLARDLMASQ